MIIQQNLIGAPKGTVLDQDGKPLTGANVTLYNDKGEKITLPVVTTGSGGGYTVPLPDELPNGNYYISVDGAGNNGLTGPIKRERPVFRSRRSRRRNRVRYHQGRK